jgi:hypothetical protein
MMNSTLSHQSTKTSTEIMNESFLELRARCLEIAAIFDRIDRAEGSRKGLDSAASHSRQRIDDAIQVLLSDGDDRASRLQLLFSRPYDPQWRENLGVTSKTHHG